MKGDRRKFDKASFALGPILLYSVIGDAVSRGISWLWSKLFGKKEEPKKEDQKNV